MARMEIFRAPPSRPVWCDECGALREFVIVLGSAPRTFVCRGCLLDGANRLEAAILGAAAAACRAAAAEAG